MRLEGDSKGKRQTNVCVEINHGGEEGSVGSISIHFPHSIFCVILSFLLCHFLVISVTSSISETVETNPLTLLDSGLQQVWWIWWTRTGLLVGYVSK